MIQLYPYSNLANYGYIIPHSGYIINSEDANKNKFVNSGLCKIEEGSTIEFKGDSANEYNAVIAFYDADKKYIGERINIDNPNSIISHKLLYSDMPRGTRYVCVSAREDDKSAFLVYQPFVLRYSPLSEIDVPNGENIYDIFIPEKVEDINTVYQSKKLIDIKHVKASNNQLIISNRIYNLFITFWDSDYIKIQEIEASNLNPIQIPSTAAYISYRDYGFEISRNKSMINFGNKALPYESYISANKHFDKYQIFTTRGDVLEQGKIQLDVPNTKSGQIIGFSARVYVMGKIAISHGKMPYCIGLLEVDSTNIIEYGMTMEDKTLTPHNLTIKDYIDITIKQEYKKTALLRISSNGKTFEKEIKFNGSEDAVIVENTGGQLAYYNLSYYSTDYNKPTWLFGDSYFDYISVYLDAYKCYNGLLDSYSGRNSQQAMSSLKKGLNVIGMPKTIYWAMGMNDADDADKANINWLNVYKELCNICVKFNITLVLGTIPSTPLRSHKWKNDIIRNSGYRYVDNERIVGADIVKEWFDGLLSGDQIHPTDFGAKLLTQELINMLPEVI